MWAVCVLRIQDMDVSALSWSPEECLELRRLVPCLSKSCPIDSVSPGECAQVKRVVRSGTSDKEQIWLQAACPKNPFQHSVVFIFSIMPVKVSREMGGRYSARECKLQYARDYKAEP